MSLLEPLQFIHPRGLIALAQQARRLVETHLWAQIVVGLLLGIATGLLVGPSTGLVPPRTAIVLGEWFALPGYLFLTVIQMVVVPLVFASIIRGMASSTDGQQLKQTGFGLSAYFLTTTVLATITGIALALLVRPGLRVDPQTLQAMRAAAPVLDVAPTSDEGMSLGRMPSEISALLPDNPLLAMVEGQMLQVVVFALILGVALISLPPASARPLLELLGSVQDVSMQVVSAVMRLAPLAVFGLLAQAMIRTGSGVLSGLLVYSVTVVAGLFVLLLLDLAIVGVLGRRSPIRFLADIREPQLLAFSTGSSAATLPVTIEAAVQRLGVRPSIAHLVLPLGATVNMAGTACYHGLATVFMAQLYGIDLPLGSLVVLVLTSLGSSIGAPATPGVGIMILATVLSSVGVPLEGLALVIGVDQVLERFRCVLNVSDDLVASVVMDRFVATRHTRDEELAREELFEAQREAQGRDVVIHEETP